MDMRARVTGLLLALTFSSPALAEDAAARLSYAGADAPDPHGGGCAEACAPKLAYALVDPFIVAAPPEIAAVSAPALLPALDGGMRAGSDGMQILAAIRSDEPAEQRLAGLVTIVATATDSDTPPARTPGAASPPRPAPTPPSGRDGDNVAPAPEPDRPPPICLIKPICL